MKKYFKIAVSGLLIATALNVNVPTQVFANDNDPGSGPTGVITPFAVVTKYYYQTLNGVTYKRLWSVSGGYWIDPYWIEV